MRKNEVRNWCPRWTGGFYTQGSYLYPKHLEHFEQWHVEAISKGRTAGHSVKSRICDACGLDGLSFDRRCSWWIFCLLVATGVAR
jgi:hypothetical protein